MACKKLGLAPLAPGMHRYLVEFATNHEEFRLPEFQAVAELLGIPITFNEDGYDLKCPYMLFESPATPAVIAGFSRSMAIRYVAELWGYGLDWDTCLQQGLSNDVEVHLDVNTFKFKFYSYNRKMTRKRTQTLLDKLTAIPFKGTVDLDHPDITYLAVEDYGPRSSQGRLDPAQVFLATYITEGCRDFIGQFDLKTRNMIGNTSMDPELSFLMANMVKAREGTLMMDPFCGTASLLLPLARFGASVVGTDIAFVVVHGIGKTSRHNTGQKTRGPKENIMANFEQYNCTSKLVDVLVADTSKPCLRDDALYDAIVADPPYGIREPARKIGHADKEATVPDEFRQNRFPRSEQYTLGAVFKDLVAFAAQRLVLGGRLSFWMPEVLAEPFEVPQHPCMRLIANSQQPLGRKLARRMLTYEKTSSDVSGAISGGPQDDWGVRHAVFEPQVKGEDSSEGPAEL
eukprot:m.120273 g.120273  ORF g.120273 m.120273 type:complete len:458 (-) comp15610_c0_seq1:998-2371(-)